MKPTVRITNWYITGGRLFGTVLDHPLLKHQGDVMTSPIVDASKLEENIVETQNHIYHLETPHATINQTPA